MNEIFKKILESAKAFISFLIVAGIFGLIFWVAFDQAGFNQFLAKLEHALWNIVVSIVVPVAVIAIIILMIAGKLK